MKILCFEILSIKKENRKLIAGYKTLINDLNIKIDEIANVMDDVANKTISFHAFVTQTYFPMDSKDFSKFSKTSSKFIKSYTDFHEILIDMIDFIEQLVSDNKLTKPSDAVKLIAITSAIGRNSNIMVDLLNNTIVVPEKAVRFARSKNSSVISQLALSYVEIISNLTTELCELGNVISNMKQDLDIKTDSELIKYVNKITSSKNKKEAQKTPEYTIRFYKGSEYGPESVDLDNQEEK